jgi:pyruvate ferredoxin oxidoreductase gamma subunit
MIELRFHGRGGQGAVTSAEIVATVAIDEGKYAQAFPSFGPERRGAPVIAFARIDEKQIRDRTAIQSPDVVMVLDPTIMRIVKVAAGLKPDGILVVNTSKDPDIIRKNTGFNGQMATVNATVIAMDEIGRAITNMVLLGALIKATDMIGPEGVQTVIERRFGPVVGGKNIKAFRRALSETRIT